MSHFFLVQAPQIPTGECEALEKHFREALLNHDYTLLTNYEIQIDAIMKHPTDIMVVTANGVPTTEVTALRKRVDDALRTETAADKFVVVNYECTIFTMPAFPIPGTYGEITDPEPEKTKLGHQEVEALMRKTFTELMGEKEELMRRTFTDLMGQKHAAIVDSPVEGASTSKEIEEGTKAVEGN